MKTLILILTLLTACGGGDHEPECIPTSTTSQPDQKTTAQFQIGCRPDLAR